MDMLAVIEMDDIEQEQINEELVEFAIRQSIQDSYNLPCSIQAKRKELNSEEYFQIMKAIEKGDVCVLRQLSACASAFTETDSRGRLLLHAAAVQPHADILQVVLQVQTATDVTLEQQTEDGDTALILAAEVALPENVRNLLQHGASPHNTNSRNESPLLIAVRQRSYDLVSILIMGGANVEQLCRTKWTATHEAAKVGCPEILMLLLRHGGGATARDGHGVTPLGIAAEHGNAEALDILIQHGGDVSAQAINGDSVLYDAAGSGNLDCVELLLSHGADANVASNAFQLPIHRAAYEGHYLALRTLIPLTRKKAIRLSGQNPVHSAADGGQAVCLELLLQKGFDVNALLGTDISENYGDLRKSPLFFAVCNGDLTCAQMLLEAGARTDLDPLRCILVAIRAERCFQCCHDNSKGQDSTRADLHNQAYEIYRQPGVISFCEFVSVSWLAPLVASVVRMLLDYVNHVDICTNLRLILEKRPEWADICDILGNPRSLQHLCRLVIRARMTSRRLNNPEAMAAVPFPPRLKSYLTYREYDL
ncbi:ankyrin repeat and SOCS box protein 15b isoform X3 [Genypterus blacodes]|uniref:ankyrin repeat and SOCS box protein 15b isoform X3 n=1 Tax=Genypterus blacodes TaxID=154954 RepID=UPI003F76EF61